MGGFQREGSIFTCAYILNQFEDKAYQKTSANLLHITTILGARAAGFGRSHLRDGWHSVVQGTGWKKKQTIATERQKLSRGGCTCYPMELPSRTAWYSVGMGRMSYPFITFFCCCCFLLIIALSLKRLWWWKRSTGKGTIWQWQILGGGGVGDSVSVLVFRISVEC